MCNILQYPELDPKPSNMLQHVAVGWPNVCQTWPKVCNTFACNNVERFCIEMLRAFGRAFIAKCVAYVKSKKFRNTWKTSIVHK